MLPDPDPVEHRLMRRMIRKLADKTSLFLLRFRFFDRLVGFLQYQRTRMLRRRVEARLRESGEYGDVVLRGPFHGMKYPSADAHWVSCRFEKIIGCYEVELYPSIRRMQEAQRHYTDIINVGAAEGFFSVGLGLIFPSAKLVAYESEPEKTQVMRDLAALNGVADQLVIEGFCDPEALAALPVGERPLLICDVDGYETELMDPEAVPWLATADIVLELHDCLKPGITELMRSRFEKTHKLDMITSTGVAYEEFPVLRQLSFPEIHAMTNSDRAAMQDWFVMEPLADK